MTNIHNILFFSYGDARNASTWSNVPFCFSKALEVRGVTVKYVNLRPSQMLEKIWTATVKRFLNLFWKGNIYYFERSLLANSIVDRKIKKAVRASSGADLCVFTSFSYCNFYSDVPSLLLCDWTFDILIRSRKGRSPYFFEKWYIRRQKRAIEHAKLVVSLFKKSAEKMQQTYPAANIFWPQSNVINNLYDGIIDESIAELKKQSDIVLFIGRNAYLDGARMLAGAMSKVWEAHPGMELHYVGINSTDLGIEDKRIHCHGFLKKDNKEQCRTYYDLVRRARVFCNPTPVWAGYSSTVEAMYFYTPVVVSDYEEFVEDFGKDITFGAYNKEFSADSLAKDLLCVIDDNGYESRCIGAHKAVADYTWDKYVEKIFAKL